MGTIRVRFIMVALVVSFFAVGMAAFLNYFKYKSTIGGIVKSRVLVIGRTWPTRRRRRPGAGASGARRPTAPTATCC